jgi:probable rRNA maturation factor
MTMENRVDKRLWEIAICSEQTALPVAAERMREAVVGILDESSIASAEISLAIIDDATIHQINRQYLDHDYATDVLSFVLEQEGDHLVGEIVASAETAQAVSTEYGWNAETELLLYVIHGTLHLVGYEDATEDDRAEMRRLETHHLARLGVTAPLKPVLRQPTSHPANDEPISSESAAAITPAAVGGTRGENKT